MKHELRTWTEWMVYPGQTIDFPMAALGEFTACSSYWFSGTHKFHADSHVFHVCVVRNGAIVHRKRHDRGEELSEAGRAAFVESALREAVSRTL